MTQIESVHDDYTETGPVCPSAARARLRQLRLGWHVLTLNNVQKFAVGYLIVLVVVGVLAPHIVPYPKSITSGINPAGALAAPSWSHPFGTDEFGRDIFSRVLYGARLSLEASVATVGLAVLLGSALGVMAAGFGGLVDEAIMRITDVFLAFPTVVLAIVIAAFWGGSLRNAVLALSVAWWPWYARLVRGQAISIRERQYVRAARSIGTSPLRIMFGHILRSSLGPTLVAASLDMGQVILSLAALSFLGLGAQPPTPEWGLMINQSREYFLQAWWYMAFPGMAIALTAFCWSILGEGMGLVFNPKTRGRGE
jgi:peptide/nickel transport system permease protein